jgi:hypothetical protein
MINRYSLMCFCLLVFIVPSRTLFAQNGWRKETMLGLNDAPLTKLRGIAIPAEAEYMGQRIKAYVFFSGYDGHAGGPGYPFLGIHVENIEKYVPASEIDKFRGPDISPFAVQADAIQLSITQGNSVIAISTPLLFTDGKYFDTGFETDGFFEANPRKTKGARSRWAQFLARMSNGFEEGKALIGATAFPSELTVRFSGNGLGEELKELLAYCTN